MIHIQFAKRQLLKWIDGVNDSQAIAHIFATQQQVLFTIIHPSWRLHCKIEANCVTPGSFSTSLQSLRRIIQQMQAKEPIDWKGQVITQGSHCIQLDAQNEDHALPSPSFVSSGIDAPDLLTLLSSIHKHGISDPFHAWRNQIIFQSHSNQMQLIQNNGYLDQRVILPVPFQQSFCYPLDHFGYVMKWIELTKQVKISQHANQLWIQSSEMHLILTLSPFSLEIPILAQQGHRLQWLPMKKEVPSPTQKDPQRMKTIMYRWEETLLHDVRSFRDLHGYLSDEITCRFRVEHRKIYLEAFDNKEWRVISENQSTSSDQESCLFSGYELAKWFGSAPQGHEITWGLEGIGLKHVSTQTHGAMYQGFLLHRMVSD